MCLLLVKMAKFGCPAVRRWYKILLFVSCCRKYATNSIQFNRLLSSHKASIGGVRKALLPNISLIIRRKKLMDKRGGNLFNFLAKKVSNRLI